MSKKLLVWFKDVEKEDIAFAGKKGAHFGEMIKAGFPVPPGFIVTAHAYQQFLEENKLTEKITNIIHSTKFDDQGSLEKSSKDIKKLIVKGNVSETFVHEVFNAYKFLGGVLKDALVAVRSSTTNDDIPHAFEETYLHVKGEANVFLKIKDAWASLYNPQTILYRHEKKHDQSTVNTAVIVQKMIESEKSGKMFSIDPITNDKNKIVIEAIFGLGELLSQNSVTPDRYEISKNTVTILNKKIEIQKVKLVKKGTENKTVQIPLHRGKLQKLAAKEILSLAHLGKMLEKHYYFPQETEWAIEGGEIYLVNTRPVTTIKIHHETTYEVKPTIHDLLLLGGPASPGIASGPVKIVQSAHEIEKIIQGDIVVTSETNPDFLPAMKKAAAIITDNGGKTSHAAIASQEIGIPAVVGTENATKKLQENLIVTVNGTKGEVYKGSFQASQTKHTEIHNRKTATKLSVCTVEPELAGIVAQKNIDGVIEIHPKKFIQEEKQTMSIEKLAERLEKICSAFSPRPVVYQIQSLTTDHEVFEMELEAIKLVRNKQNLKNLWLMLPSLQTVQELVEVKHVLTSSGLHRSPSLKLWMEIGIPSQVILLDTFIEIGMDGVSINAQNLTQLLLGLDRDNNTPISESYKRNEAALWAYEKVIKTCHTYRITSSFYGQSLSPEFIEKLVHWGITNISVSPDMIEKTRAYIAHAEEKITM